MGLYYILTLLRFLIGTLSSIHCSNLILCCYHQSLLPFFFSFPFELLPNSRFDDWYSCLGYNLGSDFLSNTDACLLRAIVLALLLSWSVYCITSPCVGHKVSQWQIHLISNLVHFILDYLFNSHFTQLL